MKNSKRKQHWEGVYKAKASGEVSWFKANPETSVEFILSTHPDKEANIIDIGGGDSVLVDKLIELGFKNVSVLDISAKALEKAKARLGEKAALVNWIESDILDFDTGVRFEVWHDWAMFHFLINPKEALRYAQIVSKLIKPSGFLIIAAFSPQGPKKCSGLNVAQYSEDSVKEIFGRDFLFVRSVNEDHRTPFNTVQNFLYIVFQKK